VVLGFGVLAVVTVLILAFSGKPSEPELVEAQLPIPSAPPVRSGPVTAPVAQERTDTRSIMEQMGISRTPAQTQQPAPKSKLVFARQKNVPAEYFIGGWQAMIGSYTAVAQLDGKVYQIILAPADPNAARTYSTGTYTVSNDLITFTPQTHWPAPNPGAGRYVAYSKLTRGEFSLLAAFQDGKMYWQNAPDTERQVYTTPKSPLFMTEDVNYVAWQKVSR